MAACPLRRRCNCSTHAPCSTHTPSPRMRSYFGRRCYFSVHAPIVFGMRERDATEPSGRRLAHTLLCSQGGGRRCHRMRGLRGLERIPGEQHPDGAQVRDEGGGGACQPGVHEVRYGESAARGRGLTGSAGMPKMRCIRSSERRATRWRCRARAEPYVRYVASRGLRTYGPWSTLDGSAPLSGKLC